MTQHHSYKTDGLLVIRRINYFSDTKYKSRDTHSSVHKTHEEVLMCYRGIEGEPWPIENKFSQNNLSMGLASLDQLPEVMEYYREASKKCLCDLIYVIKNPTPSDYDSISNNFAFCGFDYGVYESEFICYSAIFNEVIYGKYTELKSFGNRLNDSLLLPTQALLADFCDARNELLKAGADLETTEVGEEFSSISVHRII